MSRVTYRIDYNLNDGENVICVSGPGVVEFEVDKRLWIEVVDRNGDVTLTGSLKRGDALNTITLVPELAYPVVILIEQSNLSHREMRGDYGDHR